MISDIYIYSFIIPPLDGGWRQFCSSFFRTFWKLARNMFLISKIHKQDGEQWMEVLVPCDFFLLIDNIQPNQLKLVVYPPLFDQDVEAWSPGVCVQKMTDANRCWNLGCTTCSWFQWALTGPPDPVDPMGWNNSYRPGEITTVIDLFSAIYRGPISPTYRPIGGSWPTDRRNPRKIRWKLKHLPFKIDHEPKGKAGHVFQTSFLTWDMFVTGGGCSKMCSSFLRAVLFMFFLVAFISILGIMDHSLTRWQRLVAGWNRPTNQTAASSSVLMSRYCTARLKDWGKRRRTTWQLGDV